MQRKQKVSYSIVFVLLIGLLYISTFSPKSAYTATSTPTAVKASDLRIFPRDLYCDAVKETGDGPTWEIATIGKTTLIELEAYLNTIDDYQNGFLEDGTFFFRPATSDDPQLGLYVFGCTVDGIVTVLAPYEYAEQYQPINLYQNIYDLISIYGLPDAVTWTDNPPSTNLAFWFKQGLAVEVKTSQGYTYNDFVYQDYEVVHIIYFPFQELNGYETRWPFNKTRSGHFPVQGMGTPEAKQNPFDFETILMTITAQPNRTATTVPRRPTKTP
jgi:hypothetical protein